MNPNERHQPMAMRFVSGTPTIYMSMDPPEWRECVPASSRGKYKSGRADSMGISPDNRNDI